MARKFKVDSFINETEHKKYQETVEQFKQFEELKSFINNLHEFYW